MIQSIIDKDTKEIICRDILMALPEWFEISDSIGEYATGVRDIPFWADIENDICRGFVAMKATSPYAAEIYVMGVRKEYHRVGIGKALCSELMRHAAEQGYEYLHVKTVAEGMYEDYDRTNCFYKSVGFRELECMETLWGADNPCQIYVMAIKS